MFWLQTFQFRHCCRHHFHCCWCRRCLCFCHYVTIVSSYAAISVVTAATCHPRLCHLRKVAVDAAMVKSVLASEACSLERSIERLKFSILDDIFLIDSLIYSNIVCVTAFQMCRVTKSQGNQNKKTENTILKKWCHRFFFGSEAFALGITKSQT